MGEDVDFYDCGAVADPQLVAVLRALKEAPVDPESLALALDRRCGHDIRFKLYQLHPNYAARRRRTGSRLNQLQKYANQLLLEGEGGADVSTYSVTLDDLFDDSTSAEERQHLTLRLIAAIELLAGLPLRQNFEKYRGRPRLYDRTTEVVRAISEYWTKIEGKPFGGGLERQAKAALTITRHSSASFTKGVIDALGIECTDAQLETHIRNVATASQS